MLVMTPLFNRPINRGVQWRETGRLLTELWTRVETKICYQLNLTTVTILELYTSPHLLTVKPHLLALPEMTLFHVLDAFL